MKAILGLVALAALLFLVGGIGTIASFIAHADQARVAFMYVFLAGLVPTMIFLVVSLGIGAYHLYLNRVAGRTPSGWFASVAQERDGGALPGLAGQGGGEGSQPPSRIEKKDGA